MPLLGDDNRCRATNQHVVVNVEPSFATHGYHIALLLDTVMLKWLPWFDRTSQEEGGRAPEGREGARGGGEGSGEA